MHYASFKLIRYEHTFFKAKYCPTKTTYMYEQKGANIFIYREREREDRDKCVGGWGVAQS